jgi:hypothetical protein
MKTKLTLCGLFLLTSLLASACYGTNKNPKRINLPKYVPVVLTSFSMEGIHAHSPQSCTVGALDLLGAWVAAGAPENDPFDFNDVTGKTCQGIFSGDIQPLFNQPNLWYPGAISCTSCHTSDVTAAYARMNLSDYQGILAGSGRSSNDTKGEDILGGGKWQDAKLFDVLSKGEMPPNRPASTPVQGLLVSAGKSK